MTVRNSFQLRLSPKNAAKFERVGQVYTFLSVGRLLASVATSAAGEYQTISALRHPPNKGLAANKIPSPLLGGAEAAAVQTALWRRRNRSWTTLKLIPSTIA